MPNSTQIPNRLIDEVMPLVGDTAFRVLVIIARQTYGWIADKETGRRKEKDWISYSQLKLKTGRGNTAVAEALRELEEKNLISISDEKGNVLATKESRRGKRLFYRIQTSPESGQVDTNLSGNQTPESGVRKADTQKKTYTKLTETKDAIANAIAEDGFSLNELIGLFEPLNPDYSRFYSNKTERKALQWLVDKYGSDKVKRMLEQLPEVVSKPYAPRITSPLTLRKKIGDLSLFVKQEKGKYGGITVIRPDGP